MEGERGGREGERERESETERPEVSHKDIFNSSSKSFLNLSIRKLLLIVLFCASGFI
jgi:hypothetical protein